VTAVDFDAELGRFTAALRRAWAVGAGDRVLDVGCGAGQTTREAARVAAEGSALGVDVSSAAVTRARELAGAEGLGNVAFECADAQVHRFAPGSFDVAVSRFGTMFFDDPVAAFSNIGRALRPDGRLVMLVWQAADRNEWDGAVRRALGAPAADAEDGPDAFSLADPARIRTILGDAGFAGVEFAGVDEPVHYGPDAAAALGWVRRFACTNQALQRLDAAAADRALARLHDMLAARAGADGVWFDARAWIVTAHRRGGR
jgi:SAM-dependent methyltransferase